MGCSRDYINRGRRNGPGMKTDHVPQDNSPTYYGHTRLLYATDAEGRYRQVQSTGWEAESDATMLALDDQRRQTRCAWEDARAGNISPLKYYMLRQRMDLASLAQAVGLWQWRVRRHFRPAAFDRLDSGMLNRYSEALGIPVADLCRVPDSAALDIWLDPAQERCCP